MPWQITQENVFEIALNSGLIVLMSDFHERLEQEIERLGLTKKEFALKLGKSQNWAQMCIKNKQDIYTKDLLLIEERFGIDLMYLLKGDKK